MEQMTLAIGADKSNLAFIDRSIIGALEAWGFQEARRCQFALHEAVINAIQAREHLAEVPDDQVYIEMTYEDGILKASVSDSFGGIKQSDRDEAHCEWCENGRGMMLMERMVDQLTYANNAHGGFTVEIVMHD